MGNVSTERNKLWMQRHPDKLKEKKRRYYERKKARHTDADRERLKANAQRFRATHPQATRESKLVTLYGVTIAEKDAMYVDQDGRCALCDTAFIDAKDVCVDHNHTTKQTRSLLCRKCNLVLGLVREDKDLLVRMSDYLEYWETDGILDISAVSRLHEA